MDSITRFITGNSIDWLNEKFESTQNPCGKHFLVRMGYLGLVPLSAITCVLDVIIGLGFTIATITTLGRKKQLFVRAIYHLSQCHLSQGNTSFLALPFYNLLNAINPSVQSSYRNKIARSDGFLSDDAITFFKKTANRCYTSEDPFTRHVWSRFTYVGMFISLVVTRTVDLAIGVLAALGAIIALGNVESLNYRADTGLQGSNIIKDLSYCIIKIINPWTAVEPKKQVNIMSHLRQQRFNK